MTRESFSGCKVSSTLTTLFFQYLEVTSKLEMNLAAYCQTSSIQQLFFLKSLQRKRLK